MKKYDLLLSFILALNGSLNAQWITLDAQTSVNLDQVQFANDSIGYLFLDNGYIKKTTDGGTTWTSGNSTQYYNMFLLSSDIMLAGEQGIFKSTDGTNSWSTVLSTTDYIYSFSFPGNSKLGYAAGVVQTHDTTVIYKTMDRGNSWYKIYSSNAFKEGALICFTDSITGYLVDYFDGSINKTLDGAQTWAQQYYDNSEYGSQINSIQFPAADTGFAVGYHGSGSLILKTTDGGQHWIAKNQSATDDPLYSVFFVSTNHGFAGGGNGYSSGEIIETKDSGNTWSLDISNSNTFQSIYFSSGNVGYGCGLNGEIDKYLKLLGTVDLSNEYNIDLYPNPSTNEITIYHPSLIQRKATVSIIDMLGKVMKQEEVTWSSEERINIKDLAVGIYFMHVTDENASWIGRFAKQ